MLRYARAADGVIEVALEVTELFLGGCVKSDGSHEDACPATHYKWVRYAGQRNPPKAGREGYHLQASRENRAGKIIFQ